MKIQTTQQYTEFLKEIKDHILEAQNTRSKQSINSLFLYIGQSVNA